MDAGLQKGVPQRHLDAGDLHVAGSVRNESLHLLCRLLKGQLRVGADPLDVLWEARRGAVGPPGLCRGVTAVSHKLLRKGSSACLVQGLRGNVCPARARRATFVFSILSLAPNLFSPCESPK